MLDICGLHRIQRALIGCVVLALTSADGAPALERDGGRATTDTDHGIYPWTRRYPARERVR